MSWYETSANPEKRLTELQNLQQRFEQISKSLQEAEKNKRNIIESNINRIDLKLREFNNSLQNVLNNCSYHFPKDGLNGKTIQAECGVEFSLQKYQGTTLNILAIRGPFNIQTVTVSMFEKETYRKVFQEDSYMGQLSFIQDEELDQAFDQFLHILTKDMSQQIDKMVQEQQLINNQYVHPIMKDDFSEIA